MKSSPSFRVVNMTSLEKEINKQRTRLYRVEAVLACLGHSLHDVYAPGSDGPELQYVTDTLRPILNRIASKLDPTVLRKEHIEHSYPTAAAIADGLRDAAAQCTNEQAALCTRLIEAARFIDGMIGREARSTVS